MASLREAVKTGVKTAVTPAPGNEGQNIGLLGSVAFITGIFGALGITTELTSRMMREQGDLAIAAVVCGGFATIVGFAATALYSSEGDAEKQHDLYVVGFWVLGLGTVLAALAAGRSQQIVARPSVSAAVVKGSDSKRALRVLVTSDGLRLADRLTLIVERLNRVEVRVPGPGGGMVKEYDYIRGRPLYGATVGSDRDGHASHTVDVALPPGDYGDVGVQAWVRKREPCYNESAHRVGCVARQIVRVRESPQLDARWSPLRRLVRLGISATDIPSRSMTLDVSGRVSGRRSRKPLAQFVMAPNRHGDFRRTLDVAVPRNVRSVCAVAFTRKPKPRMARRRARCPASQGFAIAWVRLTTTAATRKR